MKYLAILLLQPLFAFAYPGHAQAEKKNYATITIATHERDTCVTIKLFYDYFPRQDDKLAKTFTTTASGGKCHFTIPLDESAYFSFGGIKKGNYSRLYYIEPGDSISVVLDSVITFTGRGAARLQLQQQLYELSLHTYVAGDPHVKSQLSSYQWKLWRLRKTDSLLQIRTQLIDACKDQISAKAYQQINLDILADLYAPYYERTYVSLSKPVDSSFIQEAKAYEDAYQPRNYHASVLSHKSRSYHLLLLYKLRADFFIRAFNASGKKSPVHLSSIITEIERMYSGMLKDKLITTAFMEWFDDDENAGKSLKTYLSKAPNQYRDILQQLADTRLPGASIKHFNFINQDGDTVSLEAFKGKAVVLTFWTAYCYHCKVLGLRMKELKPRIKQLGDVEMVYVCVDKDKAKWLQDIQKNTFTQEDDINLYAGSFGHDHPFLKTYDYLGMPSQMIIDKRGRLVTTHPSRPSTPEATTEFLRQVNEAL